MKTVQIFTDGACSGNPGPGGWGAILRYGTAEKELSGGAAETTNNRMELTGVISALAALKEPCQVLLTTDSKYVVDSVTKGWVYGWQKKSWKKSDNSPALNVDLWERLLPLLKMHEVEFVWVKGHAGHPENERCDRLAVEPPPVQRHRHGEAAALGRTVRGGAADIRVLFGERLPGQPFPLRARDPVRRVHAHAAGGAGAHRAVPDGGRADHELRHRHCRVPRHPRLARELHGFSCSCLPGIRVVAELAAHGTTLQENQKSNAWSIY